MISFHGHFKNGLYCSITEYNKEKCRVTGCDECSELFAESSTLMAQLVKCLVCRRLARDINFVFLRGEGGNVGNLYWMCVYLPW